jgi:outer membrane lipoprotein SlyB
MKGFWLAALFLALVPPCFAAEVNVARVLDTLAEVRLDQMITMTAGDVSGKALDKFGSDFESYWRADGHGRSGKVFEAIVANTTNRRAAATRDGMRLVPTAMLGQATDEADLLLFNRQGQVLDRIQAKLGFTNVKNAVGDPKYAGMKLITSQETYDELVAEVAKRAKRTGGSSLSLSKEWRRVAQALKSGRILPRLPCGAPLPQNAYIESVARNHYSQLYARRLIARPRPRPGPAAGIDDAAKVASQSAPKPAGTGSSAVDQSAKAVVRTAPHAVNALKPSVPAASATDELASATARSADDVIRPASKLLGRAAGVAGVAWEVGSKGWQSYKMEQRFAKGEVSHYEREVEHAANAGAAVGGLGGTAGGLVLGAEAGTVICPGVGTLAGAVVGAVGGGIAGEKVMRDASANAVVLVHKSGTTVTEVASKGWNATSQAASDTSVVAARWAEKTQIAASSAIDYTRREGGPMLASAAKTVGERVTAAWGSARKSLGW